MLKAYELRKRAITNMKKTSSKKLLEKRKTYNEEFKRLSREELIRRGAWKKKRRISRSSSGLFNLYRL